MLSAPERRSMASSSQAAEEAVATGPLGALSHDELGIIFDGLADPLEPVVAVALSSTCLGLRTPLLAALEVLKERHARAAALCRKMRTSCVELRDADELAWEKKGLTTDDMATLAMILRTNGLPGMKEVYLRSNGFGDAGMQVLCEGLGRGAAPSLRILALSHNNIGPAGAETLATALGRGAMPKLEELILFDNPIGVQGATALAAHLRKLPALKTLSLRQCNIGDEGVTSLLAGIGKDDFKALLGLQLDRNALTKKSCATIATAIESGAMPELLLAFATNDGSQQVVDDAVQRFRFEPRVEAMLRADSSDGEEPHLDQLTIKIIFEKLERASGLPANGLQQLPMIRSAITNMMRKLNLVTIPYG